MSDEPVKVEWVVEQLWDFTRAHVIASVHNKQDREDLIQDILMLYVEMTDRYWELPPNEFLVNAKTSARNLVRDFARRRKTRTNAVPHHCETERIETINLDQICAKMMLGLIRSRLGETERIILDALKSGMELAEIRQLAGMSRADLWRKMKTIKETAKEGVNWIS